VIVAAVVDLIIELSETAGLDGTSAFGRLLSVTTAVFGGFLPILYGGDDRQRSSSGGLPFRMWL
jgi:hypothetical protein